MRYAFILPILRIFNRSNSKNTLWSAIIPQTAFIAQVFTTSTPKRAQGIRLSTKHIHLKILLGDDNRILRRKKTCCKQKNNK